MVCVAMCFVLFIRFHVLPMLFSADSRSMVDAWRQDNLRTSCGLSLFLSPAMAGGRKLAICHGNTEELSVKEVIFGKPCRDRIIITDYMKLGTHDALRFGQSRELKTKAARCIVVTNKPPEDSDQQIVERYHGELERLRNNIKVEVHEVEAKSTSNGSLMPHPRSWRTKG